MTHEQQGDDGLINVYVYPDGEVYEEPPSWKSDDYETRKQGACENCGQPIVPHYGKPFASCDCGAQEWYQ